MAFLNNTGLERVWEKIIAKLNTKVDKVSGKGLSTNDYTTAEKNKLAGIATGATKVTVDSALSSSSTNPVQNKVVNTAVSNLSTLVGDTAVATQISNYAAPKSHTHNYAGSSSAGGSATSAVKATQDSDGSQINTTYVKKSGSEMSNLNALTATTSTTANISPNANAVASSPFARDSWHDHFAFLSGGHIISNHQVTTDGSTWTDSTLNLMPLFMQKESTTVTILGTTELARKFTIECSNIAYSGIGWYEVGVGYSNPFSQFEIYIETSNDNSSWSQVHKSTITGNSAPFFLKGNSFGGNKYLRFTFTKKTNTTTGTVSISCIKAYTQRKANQGLGIEYEYPYDWNASRDMYPHSDNSRSLGLSNRRWKNIYATTFTGALAGNASTATKSTQDSAGQQINTTYIKGLSASGRTITYTKGDGSTGTITTQDTTYSNATTSAAGLMSKDDKTKLDNLGTLVGDTNVAKQISDYAAPKSHTHDDRYYTESEIDSKLSGKANSSHGTHIPSTCTTITDWNSATTNGWYMGSNISNQPVANGGWYYGLVIAHNSNYIRQIAWHFATDNSVAGTNCDRFERVKHNGTWGSWVNTSVRIAVPSNAKFTDTTYSTATTSANGLMSSTDKSKLNGIAEGANKTTVDSALSSSSTNPVQNKAVNTAITALNELVGDTPVSQQILNAKNGCITGLSVSGTKITYTKGDGSTGTITTQDTNTDTKVTQNVATSNATYPLLLAPSGQTATTTTTSYFDSGVTLNPSTNTIVANVSGNAATATKWANARNINGMSVQGDANRFNYGSCSTAAATAAKVVDCSGFALATGSEITVKFTVTNTAANPTLNVNGTGAKAIYYKGAAITAGYLAANKTYTFRYNGSQYDLVGDIDTNTTNSAGTSNKTGTKMFLVGATSQTSATTTYSNSGVYIGTDNCLYSNGSKVATASSVSDVNTALTALSNKVKGCITVAKSGAQFSTIAAAIEEAKTRCSYTNRVLILILDNAIYDEDISLANNPGIDFAGFGATIRHSSAYPKAPIYTSGRGTFMGINFENYNDGNDANPGYAFHFDYYNEGHNYSGQIHFINCSFTAKKTNGVGIGMGPDVEMIFDNCSFRSTTHAALYIHNSPWGVPLNDNGIRQYQIARFNNCNFLSDVTTQGATVFDDYTRGLTSAESPMFIYMNNCSYVPTFPQTRYKLTATDTSPTKTYNALINTLNITFNVQGSLLPSYKPINLNNNADTMYTYVTSTNQNGHATIVKPSAMPEKTHIKIINCTVHDGSTISPENIQITTDTGNMCAIISTGIPNATLTLSIRILPDGLNDSDIS